MDLDANLCHVVPMAGDKYRTHVVCLHGMFLIYHRTVVYFLREKSYFIFFTQHHKEVNANVDLLPLLGACLATAACLLLMSVNTFSESALGILSKEQSKRFITKQRKHLTFHAMSSNGQ